MEPLLVADSFRVRVRAGVAEVRGFDLHLARFAAGVAALPAELRDASTADFEGFLATVPARLAAGGAGFPRLEAGIDPASGGLAFGVRLRDLPPLGTRIELRTADGVVLATPQTKGPNIARLSALNAELGAEALLLGATGAVLEGATTSLLWWEADTLTVVASTERIDSVTERLLLRIAAPLGVTSVRRPATPKELKGREIWAVNALHGIRPVATLDGTAAPRPDPARLHTFQRALDSTWQAVAGPTPADA